MKNNQYFLNTALALVVGLACAVVFLVKVFVPAAVVPGFDIPNMVALSLVALVIDHYGAGECKRCYACLAILGALTFGLLPWCAALVTGLEAPALALKGGLVFTAVTWLYSAMADRLSSGPNAKAAPLLSALGLYLAAQCFAGMF